MDYPNDRRYSKEHEWARQDGSLVTVGITHHAQDALGDIVYIELPKPGRKVNKGEALGVVESTKAVSDIFSPVTGTVAEVNDPLTEGPETVNTDPHGKGWMVKIEPASAGELNALMDAAQYTQYLADGAH